MAMTTKPNTMWLSFSLCDGEGQYRNGFALELLSVSLHCLVGKDMVWDLTHLDGENERITLNAVEGRADHTLFFRLGDLAEFVAGVTMRGQYPAVEPITKVAFRQRCGTGRLLNEAGHFAAAT